MELRRATEADIEGIAIARLSNGGAHDDSGADPGYCRHLIADGHLVVAVEGAHVLGFGGAIDVGDARLLADLYVHRDAHGNGAGKALLEAVLHGAAQRFTFASTDPAALPLYARAGMLAWWPLLSMSGPTERLDVPDLTVADVGVADAAEFEGWLTGHDRTATYRYWAGRSASHTVGVWRGGELVAVAAARSSASSVRIEHLTCAGPLALAAVAAVGDAIGLPTVHAYVPGNRPLAAELMGHGFHVLDTQVFMTTTPGVVPDALQVVHPGLA